MVLRNRTTRFVVVCLLRIKRIQDPCLQQLFILAQNTFVLFAECSNAIVGNSRSFCKNRKIKDFSIILAKTNVTRPPSISMNTSR